MTAQSLVKDIIDIDLLSQRLRSKFLIFGSPLIGENEISEVVDSMRLAWLGTGPKTARFENDFAGYLGVKKALAVNSCTAALHLSFLAAGLKPGDEVITTPLTFCATVNAIIHVGAKPVLADVSSETMNIDPIEIEKKITTRTKAIVPVHFGGRSCEMDEILSLARSKELLIIEDCAHAIETTYKGMHAGTMGDFGCFSFYATKNIATGEGGMLVSNNEEYQKRVKILSLHGMSHDAWKRFSDDGYKHYSIVEAGFKYNMMDIQAAIGIHQLSRVNEFWERRHQIWNTYNRHFSQLPIGIPLVPAANTRHGYHLYTILIDEAKTGIARDEFLARMQTKKIGVGVHYLSIPEHPYYQKTFGWRPEDFPSAARIGRQTVSLPLSPKLSDEDVEDVILAVRDILK